MRLSSQLKIELKTRFCDQGWTTDGTNPSCSVDVDECSGATPRCSRNPNVPCINLPGSFRWVQLLLTRTATHKLLSNNIVGRTARWLLNCVVDQFWKTVFTLQDQLARILFLYLGLAMLSFFLSYNLFPLTSRSNI